MFSSTFYSSQLYLTIVLKAGVKNMTGEMANMTVLGLVVGIVVLVSIVLMAIVGGSHVFD